MVSLTITETSGDLQIMPIFSKKVKMIKRGHRNQKKKPTGSGKSTTVGLAAVGINGSIKDQEMLK